MAEAEVVVVEAAVAEAATPTNANAGAITSRQIPARCASECARLGKHTRLAQPAGNHCPLDFTSEYAVEPLPGVPISIAYPSRARNFQMACPIG